MLRLGSVAKPNIVIGATAAYLSVLDEDQHTDCHRETAARGRGSSPPLDDGKRYRLHGKGAIPSTPWLLLSVTAVGQTEPRDRLDRGDCSRGMRSRCLLDFG